MGIWQNSFTRVIFQYKTYNFPSFETCSFIVVLTLFDTKYLTDIHSGVGASSQRGMRKFKRHNLKKKFCDPRRNRYFSIEIIVCPPKKCIRDSREKKFVHEKKNFIDPYKNLT